MTNVTKIVSEFKTKYQQGFTREEIKKILEKFPNINMDKFNDALFCNTCMLIDDEIITYHSDIITALRCGLENRNIHSWEWD